MAMKHTARQRMWLLVGLLAVLLTVSFVVYSSEAFEAAKAGFNLWWEVVFPALLPFFILSELLMGLGVVHAMGALLEPLMRPVFRVPGVGAFAFAMGLASGYPIGAKITGDLRRGKLCSRVEGERLLTFTNTADPLFMIGAVAVGMFHNPALGAALAGAHYVSSILLGLIMRFYGRKEEREQDIVETPRREGNIFALAVEELLAAREKDGRSFGKLLGDSIRESVFTLVAISGFIMLFSVITKMLMLIGVVAFLTKVIMFVLAPFKIAESLVLPIIGGIFEITNGANLAAQATAPLFQKVAICSAIIAWSGFSVHAQVASMIQNTDIRIGAYIWARVLHAVLAALCTFLFMSPAQSVFAPINLPAVFSTDVYSVGVFIGRCGYHMHNLLNVFGIMLIISLAVALLRRIRVIVFRYSE